MIALRGLPAILVAAGVLLSLAARLRRPWSRSAVRALRWNAQGLELAADDNEWRPVRIEACSVPTSWLAVVSLRDTAGGRWTACLTPDACEPKAFRHLRVWLRWHRREAQPAPQ